jgi:hypothetical protein
MYAWPSAEQVSEGERPEHDEAEQQQSGALHPPQRRQISGVKQVLRGKIPGIPG